MITFLGFSAPWPFWWLVVACVVAPVFAAAHDLRARRMRRIIGEPRYEWCDDCQVWCHEDDDPCDCCELPAAGDDPRPNLADEIVRRFWRRRLAPVLEPIGAYDDGEPVTGELYGPQDNACRIRTYLPVERQAEPYCGDPSCDSIQCWEAGPHELNPDDAWTRELAELNRARRSGELDELNLDDTARRLPYIALSDDPDLIEWDAKRQAARAWEIAYLEFPALRARLAVEYAAAADDCRDYYGRRMVAA